MYINDTHIIFYLTAALLGLTIGQFIDWVKERLVEHKKVFSTDIIRRYKIDFRPNYALMLITSAIYVGLIYKFGIQADFIGNLNLIKYILLTPMLLAAFVIDYKHQIIPNRLNLTIFEMGLIIAFIFGASNIAITIDMLLGMITGTVIFLIIMGLGYLVTGKQAMGLGDVKLMGALGLYVGFTNIIIISILSILIGAVGAVLLMIIKKKKKDEYMAFGPFIVIATFITIFVPTIVLLNIVMTILTFGVYNK